jgi:hypothetical protein
MQVARVLALRVAQRRRRAVSTGGRIVWRQRAS